MTLAQTILIAIRWYVVVSALAWLVFPLVFRLLRGLPNRGLGLTRPLGLWLAVLPAWWLAAWGIVPFRDGVVVGLALAIGALVWSWQMRAGELLPFLRQHWRTLIIYELATAALFFGYILWRGFNPAIAYTEKPMELGLLTSAFHATHMPPPDVWFAGRPVNYYYLGYVLYAVPARLARIAPSVAFNLALATLFATAVVAAAAIAYNLARLLGSSRRLTVVSGALGPLFLVGVGNLATPLRLLHHPLATLDAPWWQGVGWQASRVIVDHPAPGVTNQTINEFPAFSFVLGDLHPHLLALPLFLSASAIGLTLAGSRQAAGKDGCGWRDRLPAVLLAGALGGSLYAINSWDMPPTLALALLGLVAAGRPILSRVNALLAAALAGAAVVVAGPFLVHYVPAVGLPRDQLPAVVRALPVVAKLGQTIGLVGWPKSPLGQLLEVHGLFLLITGLLLVTLWQQVAWQYRRLSRHVALTLGAIIVLAVAARFPALLLFGLPLFFAVWLWFNRSLAPAQRYLVGILALAYVLLLVTEIAYLQDAFHNRMNTLFKLYFQVWALFAVCAAVALPLSLGWLRRRLGSPAMWGAGALIGVLILGAAVYPPLSAYRWTDGLRQFQGIDGLAYLRQVAPDDAAGIAWLQQHDRTGQRVLEAAGCSYGERSGEPADRVSMATGLPTIVGWDFHEYQWRQGMPAAQAQINARQADVKQIYDAPTSQRSRQLLDQYGIDYIYVGDFERVGYPSQCAAGPPYSPQGLAQLSQLGWPIVFQQGSVTIYARPGETSR
ncbi:MAG TPA: DUF2298 domain-containing protein [Thermomicrobiaceae bacterium]|nr:DUF2298 domain-containing protein [Thermomicrobiaceae bacterium]